MRVKICGITRADDALLAAELGAAAIGFVFWPGSPRVIDPERAREIAEALPPFITTVGVFVDQPIEDVRRIAGAVPLGAVQLHGNEPVDYMRRVMQPVVKSIPVSESFAPESVDALPDEITVLLDAHDPVKRGGTGRTVDWSRAAAAAARRPIFLSGGLTPDNVRDAVALVKPYAVDLSSGVESAPGVKDHAKLRALFDAIQ